MSSFDKLKGCKELLQVLASRSQPCETCKKREFVSHLHFIVDEDCLFDPTEGIPGLRDARCGHCQGSQAVKICARCNNEFYCNESCQKSHWLQHSKKCLPSKSASNIDCEKITNSLSNGSAYNGNNSIHVATPLAQPAKPRLATNTGEKEKETPKVGKGDLVRIAVDEVDKVQQITSEVVQKSISKKISKIDLKSNDKFEFLLTFGSNPSNFYVQRNSDAEKAGFITECLNRECPKLKSWEGVETLEVGQFCAGLYETDGNWYRAKLLQKIGNEYHISFIDFGNPDAVKARNLRPLPVELIDTPALAIRCKLHDLKPNKDCDWSEESLEIFGIEVESGKYTECQVYGCNKDGIYSVDLFSSNGESICKTMKSKLTPPTDTEKITSPKAKPPSTPKVVQKSPQPIEETIRSPVVKPPTVKPVGKVVNGNEDDEDVVTPSTVPVASENSKISQ